MQGGTLNCQGLPCNKKYRTPSDGDVIHRRNGGFLLVSRYAIIARHSPEPALNSDSAQTNASSRSGLDWFSAGL